MEAKLSGEGLKHALVCKPSLEKVNKERLHSCVSDTFFEEMRYVQGSMHRIALKIPDLRSSYQNFVLNTNQRAGILTGD